MVLRALLIAGYVSLALWADEPLARLLEQYRSSPPSATLCDRIGIAYTRTGDLANAEEFFRNALKIDSGLLSARKNLGTVLWFRNRRAESEREFLKIAKVAPKDPVAQLYLGLSAYDRKEYGPAAAHLESAGTLSSENPEIFPVLIETYLESGRAADAARLLEPSARSGSTDPKIWIWLGKTYDRQKRPDDALKAFTKAIDLDPKAEQGYVALADFASAHGNRTFARDAVDRGIKNCPASANLTAEAGILWALEGDFEKAERDFSTAEQLAPEWNVPLLALGVTQLQAGKIAESASTFQKAAALDPNDYRAEYLYATALSQAGGQNDPDKRPEIESALTKAVALNPTDAKSRVALAQVYFSESRNERAISELQTALSIDANEPTALYQLSLARRRQGNVEEATRLMQRFRAIKEKSRQDENELVQILKTVR
ncbi:MAG: tetratricopeptide repeat protein [Bryobacteraceae bacterium]